MPAIPPVHIPPAETVEDLRQSTEQALNQLAIRVSKGDFTEDIDARDHRLINVGRPAERRDAVNVEFLEEVIAPLTRRELTRPRKIAPRPGPFKIFTARHFLLHPEERNADAQPHIELKIGLPAQANIGAGLIDQDVLKRNTEYVVAQSGWDTLSSTLTTAVATMSVANPPYFKDAALYKVDSEVIRAVGTTTINPVAIDRGVLLTAVATHTASSTVSWYAKIPRDAFSPSENGILSVNPIINNSERVATRTFTGTPFNDADVAGAISTYTLTLAPAPTISDFTADPQFGYVNLIWSETGGTTYKYQLFKTVGSPPAVIDFSPSQLYDEFDAINVGDYIYMDPLPKPGDASPIGTWSGTTTNTFRYGVQAINILGYSSGGDDVGPLLGDATDTNPAPDVTAISASEGPDCMEDGVTMSEVTCSWTNPADISNWGGVNIFMLRPGQTEANYMGGPWTASPQKFETDPIGENVSLYFVSQNKAQELNAILSSPSTTILLDGQTSQPNPVSSLAGQTVVDGMLLSWTENAECDLAGYEIADCGNVVPQIQSDIQDQNVIANVTGFPGNTRKSAYLFKEILFTGSSDGTVITVTPSPGWNTSAHVVKVLGTDTGKNVQFTLTNQNVSCLSNTANTITFTAASIPSGTVDFFVRGSDGIHNFYVRAYNKSGFKSEWRPAPPLVLAFPPHAPDGTDDQGIPTAWPAPGFAGGNFGYGNGGIGVAAAAQGAYPGRQNISGITAWTVRVTHAPVDGTSTSSNYSFGADTAEINYSTAPSNAFIVLRNILPPVSLPNVSVRQIEIAAVNYFGTSTFVTIPDLFGTTTVTSGRYNGFRAPDLVETVSAFTSSDLNLQKAQTYLHTLVASTIAISAPSNAREGDEITIILRQDATGGRTVTWDAAFIGASQFGISGEPNTYNIFTFHALSSSSFILKSVLFGIA